MRKLIISYERLQTLLALPKRYSSLTLRSGISRISFSQKVIRTADKDSQLSTDELDFPGMHWIQRYQIYLLEDIEAFTETLNPASYHYERVIASSSTAVSGMASASTSSTPAGLRYTKILLRSTDLRLRILGKRTQSIINLVDLQSPPLSSSHLRPSGPQKLTFQ